MNEFKRCLNVFSHSPGRWPSGLRRTR
ncbi:manganase accumulation protein MntS [Salmonella enterica]